jgi:transporter family protein
LISFLTVAINCSPLIAKVSLVLFLFLAISHYNYFMTWYLAAFLSAVFAALTTILAKVGIQNIDSNLGTAIRTSVILIFTWGIVFFNGGASAVGQIKTSAWVFLILSGIATGLSWLFYFRALQLGDASKVVPIDKLSLVLTIILAGLFLKEKITLSVMFGSILMTVGAIVIAMAK